MLNRNSARPGAIRRETPSPAVTCAIWALIIFTVVPEGFNFTGADPAGMMLDTPSMPTEGSAFSRIVWLGLLAFGAGITFSRSGLALKLIRQVNPYLLMFLALVILSTIWSIEPMVTLRRFIRILTITLDAFALALSSARVTRFQDVLRPVLTVLIVGSVLFVIFDPESGIMQSTQPELIGAWRGLTAQKNALGSLAGLCFVLWFHAYLSKESPAWVAFLGSAISATCLVSSRSSTSLMATVFGGVLMLMLLRSPKGLRRYMPYLIAAFAALILVYSLAVLNLVPGSDLLLSPLTALTGKDQTFSGRTAIWAVLNEHIALRPLLGSGYGAYWVQVPGSPSMQMLQRLYFYPTEGHDGYLDVINDLGIVGGLCLLGYLIVFLRQGLRILSASRSQGALYLTLLFVQLIGNLSESRWFNSLLFDFVIMTIATLAMGRNLLEQHTQTLPATPVPSANRTFGVGRRRAPSSRRSL